jgi:CheY-like chemotaxis protein
MRDDLFRPEVKTSDVGTAGERGTGLGLPYSREIMRAHRGDVTLHATGPAGSVFHATLPVVRPVVLVVDDERIARRVIAERLAVVDVEIVEAADGKEALERIAERTPHLIVSDYLMPGVDGFDLLRRVKRDPSTGTIPFIMTTSDTKMETRDTALRLGADDFVVKPFTPEDFLPRVKKYIV